MITVQEATDIILSRSSDFGTEKVSISDATGRVLAETIIADRDFPPFDRVAMDGIAIRFKDFDAGQRTFEIQGVQAAGEPQHELEQGKALEIMTGAMLPQNADVVVRYEDLETSGNTTTIRPDSVKQFQNVHRQGTDRKKGTVILSEWSRISPSEIGILATVGKSNVMVFRQPKVAVISTGDELVDIHDTPEPHQIRKSNVHNLISFLQGYGIRGTTLHLADERQHIRKNLTELLKSQDVLLLSGAVSRGKFDFLPQVLEELGVKQHFHRIAQRPGKPFWFGTTSNCKVFAFPGNPVSTFVCAKRFFEPWLKKSFNLDQETSSAILTKDVSFRPELTYFLQVKTRIEQGRILADPVPGHGSGDLVNLSLANGFLELPSNRIEFKEGEAFPLWPF